MPKITHEGSNIYSATLLLQWKKEKIWIWTGKTEIHTNTNEKPLILTLKEKKFYFYSTGLEKTENTEKWDWGKNYKPKLDLDQQEKIIEKLDKYIDHNDWNWKHILFKHRNNFLKNKTKKLIKEFEIISSISDVFLNPKNIKLKEEIDSLEPLIKYNQNEIIYLRRGIHMYDKRNYKKSTSYRINQKIEVINTSINFITKKLSELTKEFDSLTKDLLNEIQSPAKKLKTSQEEVDENFEVVEQLTNDEKDKNELKEFYLGNFDLGMLE